MVKKTKTIERDPKSLKRVDPSVLLVVAWFRADGQPTDQFRNRVVADLGEITPDITPEELSRVTFAAKMEVARAVARRKNPSALSAEDRLTKVLRELKRIDKAKGAAIQRIMLAGLIKKMERW